MSTRQFTCPNCRGILEVSESGQEKILECPHCKSRFSVSATVSKHWYYSQENQPVGPLSLIEMKAKILEGALTSTDLVWPPNTNQWVLAGSRSELFPQNGPSMPPPPELPTFNLGSPSDSEDIFDDLSPQTPDEGPISLKGIKVRKYTSLTWGDFQIIKKLGSGNMGAVYLAQQKSANRNVALKVLYKHLACQPKFAERFSREAEAMLDLDHPNIVRCYGVGEENGSPYFAMEFINGFDSATVLNEMGGKFPLGDALYIVLKCAEAMKHAKMHRLVHRDIKPENIMISDLGKIKITDLGLAKPIDQDLSLTDTGVSLGTPHYMAPEQAHNAKAADQRCDIYSLGGTLYRYITGHLPFQGKNMVELMQQKERGSFPPARQYNKQLHPKVDFLLDKMLAKKPNLRYQEWDDLIKDIHEFGLANDHLSFNVLRVCKVLLPADRDPEPESRVEILLIHDDHNDILLAQEALDQSTIYSNLSVVESGEEALAFLRREGKYAKVSKPELIILGLDVSKPETQAILAEFKNSQELWTIPLVVLTKPGNKSQTVAALKNKGLPVSLTIEDSQDMIAFEDLIQSMKGLCVTIVERFPFAGPEGKD